MDKKVINEFITLPCGHTTEETDDLKIVCPICKEVYQRVGRLLRGKWELPGAPTQQTRIKI